MKKIYGFKVDDPTEWGDVFEDDKKSPEDLISSACHLYYDLEDNVYAGFEVSLGIEPTEMEELLGLYTDRLHPLEIRKVL